MCVHVCVRVRWCRSARLQTKDLREQAAMAPSLLAQHGTLWGARLLTHDLSRRHRVSNEHAAAAAAS